MSSTQCGRRRSVLTGFAHTANATGDGQSLQCMHTLPMRQETASPYSVCTHCQCDRGRPVLAVYAHTANATGDGQSLQCMHTLPRRQGTASPCSVCTHCQCDRGRPVLAVYAQDVNATARGRSVHQQQKTPYEASTFSLTFYSRGFTLQLSFIGRPGKHLAHVACSMAPITIQTAELKK